MSLKNLIIGRRGTGWKEDKPDPKRDLDFQQLGLPSSSSGAQKASLRQYVREVFNQKSTSSCVGQSFAGAIGIREVQSGFPYGSPSQLFIYFNGRAFHGGEKSDSGTYIRTAAKGIVKMGVPDGQYWPFSTNPLKVNRRPGWNPYMMAHSRRGGEYVFITESDEQRLENVKVAIDAGYPVVFGTLVSKNYMNANGRTPVDKPTAGEKIIGGHASVIIGYDGTIFETLGSYGRGFGDDGFVWLTDEYVAWEGSSSFCIIHGWDRLKKGMKK